MCRRSRARVIAQVTQTVVFLGKWIGYFDTPEKAAREYDKHAKEHYKDFASLNFPEKL